MLIVMNGWFIIKVDLITGAPSSGQFQCYIYGIFYKSDTLIFNLARHEYE